MTIKNRKKYQVYILCNIRVENILKLILFQYDRPLAWWNKM